MNAKRVGLYARVSTKANGQSPQMQLECLRDYAKQRGLLVVTEAVDVGVSGRKDSRPELNRLMDLARKRKLDVVLVYKLDRFARSVRHLVNALHEFESLGVDFVSYTENLQTDTPLGRALFSIAAAMGQLEADLIRERVTEGVRRCRERRQGSWGRPRVEVDTSRVLALRAAGKSLREIGQEIGASRNVIARVLSEARHENPVASTPP